MTKRKRKPARRQLPKAPQPAPPATPFVVCERTGLTRRDALAAAIAGRMIAYQRGYYDNYDYLAQQAIDAADAIIRRTEGR